MSTDPPVPPRRIGPIELAPGVLPSQVGVFITVVILALCMVTFLPMVQALVFTELLHIPKAEQGRLAGNLVTAQQIAVLCFVGLTGSLLDRFGRVRVLIVAVLGYTVCLACYPLAGGVATLFLLQFLFGLFSTGHITGSSTMNADYPANASRGKFVALMILLQAALSAFMAGVVGARLPGWLVAAGDSPAEAARNALWAVAALGLLAAAIAARWLRDPPRQQARQAPHGGGWTVFVQNLRRVIAAGRANPRFGLVMSMGLVIRSDYLVMLSFVSLWVTNAAAGQGVSTVDALKHAGLLMLTFKLATAAAQLAFGFVVDRVDRPRLLALSLLATGLALTGTLAVHDVFSTTMFVVVALIGAAESALIVCGQAMLGEEAPPDLRGSAAGIFYFSGTAGVVVVSAVAGQLFDKVGHTAPFVLVGLLNLLFAAIAAVIVLRQGRAVRMEVTHGR